MTTILATVQSLFPAYCHERIVLVGGTVRDLLLFTTSQDIDLIAALPHDQFITLGFRRVEASSGAAIYFRHHPVFGKIEVTRIASMADLEDDLRRRDFTVNAMAMSLAGLRIDPLDGAADLQAGLLRACSSETFVVDPLRIFRSFRFEAAGWRLTPDTELLIRQQDWGAVFRSMPMERFSSELIKALTQKTPERFFQRLLEFRVGGEFLPELFQMPLVPAGPLVHHPEGDLFTHAIEVLQRVAADTDDPLARFCAFFHDLGKLATDPALYPKHHGHDDAGFAMAAAFCNRLCLPAAYRQALAWVSRLHGKANIWGELRDSTRVKMAEQARKAGIITILPLVAAADKPGGVPMGSWEVAVQVAGMTTRELGIDRERLEALPPASRPAYIMQQRVAALRRMQTAPD